jgi:hypothetical protein
MKLFLSVLVLSSLLLGCAPKVGSPKWCENMEAKSKLDWSLADAKSYAQFCILK